MNYVNKYNAILFEGDLNSNQIVRTWLGLGQLMKQFFKAFFLD